MIQMTSSSFTSVYMGHHDKSARFIIRVRNGEGKFGFESRRYRQIYLNIIYVSSEFLLHVLHFKDLHDNVKA